MDGVSADERGVTPPLDPPCQAFAGGSRSESNPAYSCSIRLPRFAWSPPEPVGPANPFRAFVVTSGASYTLRAQW